MYEQIFNEMKRLILTKTYQVGDKVPSEKELAEEYGVSRITSKKALDLLSAEGVIVRKPGRGSFVADPNGETAADKKALVQVGEYTGKIDREKMIGLVITDFSESYGTRLVYSMEQYSRENDCFLVLRRTFGDQDNEELSIQKLRNLGVNGLIVFPAQGQYFNAEILKLVIARFPLVLIDRKLKGVAAASISTDNLGAAVEAVEYLFDLGHTNISLISPPPQDTTAVEERIEGFVQAHAGRGIAVDKELWISDVTATLPSAFNESNIEQEINRIMVHLKEHPSITAFFAIEYNIALLAKVAAERIGLRVPEDLSIICFDSPQFSIGEGYWFTHMRQNEEEMGQLAVETVLGIMNQDEVAAEERLPAELVVGASTGPVKEQLS